MDRLAFLFSLGSIGAATAGQILMRMSQAAEGGTVVAGIRVSWPLLAAMIAQGAAAALWLLVLGRAPLSRAYPLTASGQVLVPIVSWLVLGERIGWQTGLSAGLAAAAVAVLAYGQ